MRTRRNLALGVLLAISLTACLDANKAAMQIGKPPEDVVKLRSLETRRYDTLDERTVLLASTQTLQDLGFTVSESAPGAGVLVASKQRDARETGQVVGAIVLAVLFGVNAAVWDEEQTINVTLVTTPIANSKQVEVRVAFDRVIRNNKQQHRGELVQDAEVYRQFFEKLSAGVQLEGQQV
ncbi:MAG: hypothetical protein JWL84_3919 [Rhodospirillales bacterium]|jgi:hypothetical protein|nr:hypothetical protein [Rhodospirillales bacterium]